MQSKNETKQQSFLYATVVLGVATVLVKVLGAIFKIPLQHLIGDDGMGYYATAYDIYLPVYSLSMAGFPVAVSRMVAEQIGKKRYRDVRLTLSVVRRVFLVVGSIGLAVMFAASIAVTGFTGNKLALPGMFVIAPSLLFCCVMSTYRGYYEGTRNMYPTAISTVIEALCKLFLGFGFAFIIVKSAKTVTLNTLSFAVAGAMLGITLGTVFGAMYLILRFRKKGDGITAEMLESSPEPTTSKIIFKSLIAIAIPVALGSLVTQVSGLIDVTMVQWQLKNAVTAHPEAFSGMYQKYITSTDVNHSGFAVWVANRLYGCYKGNAYTLFNLIPTITAVIGVSAIPVLTMVWQGGEKKEIKNNIESIVKIITLISFPAGLGMVALAPQIINLLFNSSEPVITANILRILGLATCCAGMSTPLTNMLQAIGKQNIPVRNIGVGAIIKIIANLTLVRIPQINVLGAAIGTLCCYIYISFANLFSLIHFSKTKPNLFSGLGKPFAAAAICALSAFGSNLLLSRVISHETIVTLMAIVVAAVVYVLAVSLLKCLTANDIHTLAKGEKIVKIMQKLHIIA